jgi:hypothetical protein
MGGWSNRRLALAGAVGGAFVGLLLLGLTHPTLAHTNDEYRQGASFGYVLRYTALGAAGMLLAGRLLAGDRRPALYAVGLTAVLAAAILPPVLDEETPSERRRAEAVRSGDPNADFEAGAIDGCVTGTRRQLAGTPEEDVIDVDAYCECYIPRLLAGTRGDQARLDAIAARIRAGNPPRRAVRAGVLCAKRARRD